jgi:hypothetical protein
MNVGGHSLRQRHRHASPVEARPHPVILHDVKQPAAWPDAQPISFPRRVGAPGLVRRLALSPPSPPHLRCRCRRFGGRARRNLGDSIASGPEMRGPAERREAYYLLSRS